VSAEAGARLYGGHYPSDWVVWLGATYAMDNVKTVIEKLVP
jgi:hypothetical protein